MPSNKKKKGGKKGKKTTATAVGDIGDLYEIDVDNNGLTKLMCNSHKVAACGRCCMDFGFLNKIQPKIPPNRDLPKSETERTEFLKKEIKSYFVSGQVPISHNVGETMNPGFMDLLNKQSTENTMDIKTATPLVAYMFYTARFIPMFQERILTFVNLLLDLLLMAYDELPEPKPCDIVAEAMRQNRAEERAEKKETKKNIDGKVEKSSMDVKAKIGSDMTKSIQYIAEIMGRNKLDDRGSFLSDVMCLTDPTTAGAKNNLTDLFKNASIGKNENDTFELTNDMCSLIEVATKPLKLMAEHAKDGVSIEDYSTWDKGKLLLFLQKHKLDPFPVPSQKVLLKIANEMKAFTLICMNAVNSMPDDDTAAAFGRQSMGIATPTDTEIIEKMHAPVKRELMTADAQIPANFRLDTLQDWIPMRMPKVYDSFRSLRQEWCKNYKDKTALQHNIALSFEKIAYIYDDMVQNPGKDILGTMQIFKDTASEMVLFFRPLAVWILKTYEKGGVSMPVPIIALEWHRIKKIEGVQKAQQLISGLKKGTLFRDMEPKSLSEFELITEGLKVNRNAMNVENKIELLEKQCTDKSWKFSVICPVDPDRKDFFLKRCLVCKMRATKTCSGCGIASYCSSKCQKKDWSMHKKQCQHCKKKSNK